MGYLICNKCDGYYELHPGESSEDFILKCNCGGALKLYNSLDNYSNNDIVSNFDLANILLNDPEGAKRAHAAYLLGETKDPKYVDVLCDATEDYDGNVRRLSASALGKIGDIRAEDALINLLNDVKPQVRQYSVNALKKIKSKKAIEHSITDYNPYLIQDVEYTLSNSADTTLYDQTNEDTLIRNNEIPRREILEAGKGYSEQKSLHYHNITIIGGIIGLIGLIGVYFNFISIIICFIGAVTFSYGYDKGKSWNKGIVGESIIANYLNQLPEDYIIYNDVKFPGSYGNLDHVVIGSKGIYVIETKNYKGFFIVKDKEWFYKNGKTIKRAKNQPGKQVLTNAISLRSLLISNGIDMDGVWIQSIVTLVNKNFKIQEKTRHYKVLYPETIPKFIQNSNRNIDNNIIKKIALLIESYSTGMSYIPANNNLIQDHRPTSIDVNSANGFIGDTINLIATLKDIHSNTPIQDKNIQFKINNDPVGTVNIIDGVATLPYIITNDVGTYTISAEFLEDKTYLRSINTNILNVVDTTPTDDVILQTN